jgi:hypothetical protein
MPNQPHPPPPPSQPSPPASGAQLLTPGQQPQPITRTTRSPTPTPAFDPGNPVHLLATRGVTEDNKTSIPALVSALESFGDFKKPGANAYAIGKEGATQLVAITKLLRAAASLLGDDRPVSQSDFKMAIQDLKSTFAAGVASFGQSVAPTYASMAKRTGTTVMSSGFPQKQNSSLDLQEKQIFVLLKAVSKEAPIHNWDSAIATRHCSEVITKYFENAEGGPMELPLRGISRSAAGNLTLTFKNTSDALRAREHAQRWVKGIDPAATYPERAYAVVAHNAPIDIWPEDGDIHDAIQALEEYNPSLPNNHSRIANISWLNSNEARERMRSGPLLVSYKNKVDANHAIENGLVIEGLLCSVSIYVPRPPQCYRCQDWGHRATGCTGEARCGRCAGPHLTTDHVCSHAQPCAKGEKCSTEKPKCSNCQGDHASWIRACPVAKATLEAQSRKVEYSTGKYEANTPFSFADATYTPNARKEARQRSPISMSTLPAQPSFNYIPPTSPPIPHD